MATLQPQKINGHRYSFSSIEIDLGDAGVVSGVVDISYDHGLEPTHVRANGSVQEIGRTRGEYSATGKMTLLKEDANLLRSKLGPGYMEKIFSVTVSYAETGHETTTDVLSGVRIKKEAESHSQGGDALKTEFELSVMALRMGGIDPIANMR